MATQLELFDTLTRQILPIHAEDGSHFRFYCCGPTVYGPAHIGNFRTFLVQDVFRRVLELSGLQPLHVRNITDVDDKTIRQSQAEGMSLGEFTQRWTRKFHEDCHTLNLLAPWKEPAATAYIPEQIRLIERLIERGHAYVAKDGSVYYKVSSFAAYGQLAHLDPATLRSQDSNSAGEANAADEYDREQVADFALWKAHKPEDGVNAWPSPWGPGRPGWHIECSAMSMALLGESFDLHGGGVDLIFPHHENEIAQSTGATGKRFARHWFHSAHLMVEGEKMSKSLGNLYRLDDLLAKGYTPMAIRYALLTGHYRQQLNFTFHGLDAARSALDKLTRLAAQLLEKAGMANAQGWASLQEPPSRGADWGVFAPVWDRLCDDLNVPAALGAIFTHAREATPHDLPGLTQALFALGLRLEAPDSASTRDIPEAIQQLARERWEAKAAKDFVRADALRQQLLAQGWLIKDSKEGYEVLPSS